MKFVTSTIVVLSMAMLSACAKSGGGEQGGSGQPAAQSTPAPSKPEVAPFDNLQGPYLNNSKYNSNRYVTINDRKFLIYNTDGIQVRNCDPNDSSLVCVKIGNRTEKQPIKNYTIASTPAYLQCINGGLPIGNYSNFDFRSAYERDSMKAYSKGSSRSGYCLESTWDIQYAVITQFNFDQNGSLSFVAKINEYFYQATNIGYKYNTRTRQLVISRFVARGNNPSQEYLTVTSISSLRRPNDKNSYNMLLKQTNVVGLSDMNIEPQNAGFRFSEPIMLRLSSFYSTPATYQPMQYMPVSPQPQANATLPIDPRFKTGAIDNNSRIKLMIVGGNMLLLPEEMLSSIDNKARTNGGKPKYEPFNDSRI